MKWPFGTASEKSGEREGGGKPMEGTIDWVGIVWLVNDFVARKDVPMTSLKTCDSTMINDNDIIVDWEIFNDSVFSDLCDDTNIICNSDIRDVCDITVTKL